MVHASKIEYYHPHCINAEHQQHGLKAATKQEVFLNVKVMFVLLLVFSGSNIQEAAELSTAWLSAASRKAK